MSIVKHTQVIPVNVSDLTSVAQAVALNFEGRGFDVHVTAFSQQCQEIGIHKGGTFQAIIGMKTALRIHIQSVEGGTQIEAGIGLLESQGISTAVSMLAFWPVLVTQTWGLVRQSKLDDEAIAVAVATLLAQAHAGAARYCHGCGASISGAAAFCHACGARLAP
jgi:hypothetical protein